MTDKTRQELKEFFKRNGLEKCDKFYAKHINLHREDLAKILGVKLDFFTSDKGQLSFLYPSMFSCSMFGIPGFYQVSSFEHLLELREIVQEYFQEQESKQTDTDVEPLEESKQEYVTREELDKILDEKFSFMLKVFNQIKSIIEDLDD